MHTLATLNEPRTAADEPAYDSAAAADGTVIGWERWGTGPTVVVSHGGMRAAKHYRELAKLLADRFTFVLYDRRGRGRSGPTPAALAGDGRGILEMEIGDLATVIAKTGARRVLGHSAGGLIALEAARRMPLDAVAVYEPAVSIERGIPWAWVPRCEAALAAGDEAKAFVIAASGLEVGPPAWLPSWLLALPARLLMKSADGAELAALIHTLPRDAAMGMAVDAPDASRFSSLRCPSTLVVSGASSPRYLRAICEAVARAVPGARHVVVDGDHNVPDMAPKNVAPALAAFFARPVA